MKEFRYYIFQYSRAQETYKDWAPRLSAKLLPLRLQKATTFENKHIVLNQYIEDILHKTLFLSKSS